MNGKMMRAIGTSQTSTTLFKPTDEINNIIKHVSPFAQQLNATKGEIFRYHINHQRVCYLLHSGSITLNRRGDGMVLNSEQAPFVLGISNQIVHDEHLYIRIMDDTQISRLSLERFNLIIASENLWESLCKLLIYTASRVYEHCTFASQMSSYEIIKFQLNELMQESDRTRLSITAANYIKNRTYLSRSGIMRILADLRNAGYINLQRGVLIEMSPLPARY